MNLPQTEMPLTWTLGTVRVWMPGGSQPARQAAVSQAKGPLLTPRSRPFAYGTLVQYWRQLSYPDDP